MNMERKYFSVFWLFALCFLIAGCGATGAIRQTVIGPQDMENKLTLSRPVQLQDIGIEPHGVVLVNVGAYAWGRYSEEDIRILEASIKASIKNLQSSVNPEAPALNLYIKIRRHWLAFSNTEGAVLACVAWCAASGKEIIYSEQFYAAAGGHLRSIGHLKEETHRDIIKRVLSSVAMLIKDGASSKKLPVSVEGTYTKFADAIATLPNSLTSLPPPGFVYRSGENPSAEVPWSQAEPRMGVDWPAYLKNNP